MTRWNVVRSRRPGRALVVLMSMVLVTPALAEVPGLWQRPCGVGCFEVVPASYAGSPGSAANVVDHGAVGDGIADDTAAIQAALDRGGPVFFPGDAKTVYTYRTLTLRTGNILYGNATLQLRANRNLTANVYSLAAVGITRFGISGLTFDGNKARQPGTFTSNGMLIRGASDFRIQSTRWVNWHYDAIELTSATQRPPLDANTPPADPPDIIERGLVTENTFRGIGRDSNDDRAGAGESYAIQIGSTVANLIVSNNELVDCVNGIIAAAYNRGIMITGNRIVLEQPLKFASSGIGVEQLSRHSVVANNTVVGAYRVGVNVEAAQHVTISGNVVNGPHYGISAFGSTLGGQRVDLRDVSISGNTVTSASGPAIRLVKAFAGSVTGNVVTAGLFGVQIVDVAGAAVTGNHVGGTRTGIGVSGSSDVTVSGNTVTGAIAEGLYLGRGNTRVGVFSNVSAGNAYGLYSEAGQTSVQVASNVLLKNSTRDAFVATPTANGVATLTGGPLVVAAVSFAALGNQDNGTVLYCSDCDPAGFQPCTSTAAKTGAFAYRVNSAWKCQG